MNKYSVRAVGTAAWGVLCTAPDGTESMLSVAGGDPATWNMRHQAQDVANGLNKWRGCEGDANTDAHASESVNRSVAALSSQLGHLVNPKPQPRKLSEIALEIRREWRNMSPHARPYVTAMETLSTMRDHYGVDSADTIVRYFLANAGTWRGEAARRIKAELKGMLPS